MATHGGHPYLEDFYYQVDTADLLHRLLSCSRVYQQGLAGSHPCCVCGACLSWCWQRRAHIAMC
jgi:hypothetical protein